MSGKKLQSVRRKDVSDNLLEEGIKLVNENKNLGPKFKVSAQYKRYLHEPPIEENPRMIELDVDQYYGKKNTKGKKLSRSNPISLIRFLKSLTGQRDAKSKESSSCKEESDSEEDRPEYQPSFSKQQQEDISRIFMTLNEIFGKQIRKKQKRQSRVMIVGPAGSGKTTLLNRFARDATEGKIDQIQGSDELVHIVNCRQFNADVKICVDEFLFGLMAKRPSIEVRKALHMQTLKNPKKLTFIIDSLDTMRFDLAKETRIIGPHDTALPSTILFNILTGNLFKKSRVLTSSREHAIRNYKGDLRPDRIITLAGFTQEMIRRLTIGFLGKEEGERVLEILENKCPGLLELCETPLFLIFTLIGLKEKNDPQAFIPNTMSGVMINLLMTLLHSKHGRAFGKLSEEEIIAAINKMKELSFQGTMERKVLFTQEDLKRVNLTPKEITDLVIILPDGEKSQQVLEGGSISLFAHQSIQEELCSLKVIEMDIKDFNSFVSKQLHQPQFSVIRRMLCGTLLNSRVFEEATKFLLKVSPSADDDIEKKRALLKKSLADHFLSGLHYQDLLELLHSIHEAQDGGEGILPTTVDEISLTMPLMASDLHALASSIFHCSQLNRLLLLDCHLTPESLQIFSDNLQNSKVQLEELGVSFNHNMGAKGLNAVGRIAGRCEVNRLDMADCKLKSDEVDSFNSGLRDAKLETLIVSENPNMGVKGLNAVGRIAGRCEVNRLVMSWCNLTSDEVDSFNLGLGDAKLEELGVSFNHNMGVKGLNTVGRIAGRCEVNRLKMRQCHLKSDEVDSFNLGLGDAKLKTLDVSYNPNMGVKGLNAVGRIAGRCEVNRLEMSECNLTSDEVDSFNSGLGDAKVKEIDMRDFGRKDYKLPVPAVCNLIPKVTDLLHTWGSNLSKEKVAMLQMKLDELGSTNLKIKIGKWPGSILQSRTSSEESRQEFQQEASDEGQTHVRPHLHGEQETGKDVEEATNAFSSLVDEVSGKEPQQDHKQLEPEIEIDEEFKVRISRTEDTAGSRQELQREVSDEGQAHVDPQLHGEQETGKEGMEVASSLPDDSAGGSVCQTFSKEIDVTGGSIEVSDCKITFPSGSFASRTTVKGKIENDRKNWPNGYIAITPMLFVDEGNDPLVPATVQMASWVIRGKSDAVAHILHYCERKSEWEVIKEVPLTSQPIFQFECLEFSPILVALPEESSSSPEILIDSSVYASNHNTFTVGFHCRNDLWKREMREDMRDLNSKLQLGFSTVNVQVNDILQASLVCQQPDGYNFDPPGFLPVPINAAFKKGQIIKHTIVLCKQDCAPISDPLIMRSHLEKEGGIIDGPHCFYYVWKQVQATTLIRDLPAEPQDPNEPSTSRGRYGNIVAQVVNIGGQMTVTNTDSTSTVSSHAGTKKMNEQGQEEEETGDLIEVKITGESLSETFERRFKPTVTVDEVIMALKKKEGKFFHLTSGDQELDGDLTLAQAAQDGSTVNWKAVTK